MSGRAPRTTLVVGLGATGRSVIDHLAGRDRLLAIDTRPAPPFLAAVRERHPQVEVVAPDDYRGALAAADRVVMSPGVSLDHCLARAARAAGKPLTSDIALFLDAAGSVPVVGVTATNGKSTVVSLVGALCAAAGLDAGVGGNLGAPALDLLKRGRDLYVLELSSFQLERLARPALAVAALLNVSADHADRHPNFKAYAAAKQRIYRGARKIVFNARDQATAPRRRADVAAERTPTVALNGDAGWRLDGDDLVLNGERLPAAELALRGRHNHFNALAAAAVAWQAGVDIGRQRRALTRFQGLPHRAEHVATVAGVAFVNDSKATNVGACAATLAGLAAGRNVILIAGGDAKGATFQALVPMARRHVARLVHFGRDGPLLARALDGVAPIDQAADMGEAVRLAAAAAAPGDIVLLSPACASFDMYANFAARGDDFRAQARALTARAEA